MPNPPGKQSKTIYFPIHVYLAAEQCLKDQGFKNFNQFGIHVFEEYLRKAPQGIKENKQLTPEQELDNIVSEMARIGQTLGIKRTLMREIVGKKLGLAAKNESEMVKTSQALWSYVVKHDGLVEYKGKTIGIDRNEIDLYQRLGALHFRKLKISSERQKIEAEPLVSTDQESSLLQS